MLENVIHCVHSCANPSGFFGKPTKLRAEEPSMFEILTWNAPDTSKKGKEEFLCDSCKKGSHEAVEYSDKVESIERSKAKHHSNFAQNHHKGDFHENENKNQAKGDKAQERQSLLNKRKPSMTKTKERPQSANQNRAHTVSKASKPLPNYMKGTRKEIMETDEEKENELMEEKEKKLKKFHETTRWIPNSAFTTYFGKPAFENYGRGNTNPSNGGLLYGDYLKSHNIQPHRGQNSPKFVQSYSVALLKGQQIGEIYPYPPKMNKKDMQIAQNQVSQKCQRERSPITAQRNTQQSFPIQAPQLNDLERFGGRGLQKVSRANRYTSYTRNGDY